MRNLIDRIRQAWPGVPIEWVLTDVTHERARAVEWARVAAHSLPDEAVQSRFTDTLGEVGAASAAVLAALACGYWALGCAPGRAALIALHSQPADRAALLLQEPEGAHG
ncbi:MAG: hypothetical protein JRI23_28355 [Deltaproteobacteria bacterium]|jgi:hypothetical protein|nr:hypothetical protein [Deltaproteobacteria bacterium]MBW2536009.1 hypothetical protein [Deltaproteobacteria bacterium]